MTAEPIRWALAALLLLLYAALCGWITWHWRRRQHAAEALAAGSDAGLLVAFASQTGHAETLAEATAQALRAAGHAVRLAPLHSLSPQALASAGTALIVASTYGEGDPPDQAAPFWQQCLAGGAVPLSGLRYGLLALGDRDYGRFCGFGRALDHWLRANGATPLFERIDMDGADAGALQAWQQAVGTLAPGAGAVPWQSAPFTEWRVVSRQRLNAGSLGGTIVELGLQPPEAVTWEPGDLAELRVPADPAHPRSYSIASIAQNGVLQLLVRASTRPDGTPGLASHWLTQQLQPGDTVALRVRAHRQFRLEGNATRPLVCIGNGTGLAGLRAHLRARAAAGTRGAWLLFGERQRAHDFLCQTELQAWLADGTLARLDTVFSRDGAPEHYVQDALRTQADTLRDWVNVRGAAIYVCGSLRGMAEGVDVVLREALGSGTVDALAQSGRYRRDVY